MNTKRLFDLFLAVLLILVFLPLCLIISLLVIFTSKGPAIHWSKRVGQDNALFKMPKFRSMYTNSPQLATHLMTESANSYITPIGSFLRKSSLDELPQLYSIIRGDMSFVGPRPALFNQDDLVALRTEHNVHKLKPGITGWAQVNGRDELSIEEKVKFDREYLDNGSFLHDMKIMVMTFVKVVGREEIDH